MTDAEMIGEYAPERQMERLRAIVHRLRAPGGCPWDAEQTHESLVPNLIEEAYETVAAIRSGDGENLGEELGDLLLQVVFHAEMAEEKGGAGFEKIAAGISEKLVRRHPHVFGESAVGDTEGVLRQWEEIKRAEKGTERESFLHGAGDGLPALLKAAKLQKKAAEVGFDWSSPEGIAGKIDEELAEVRVELAKHREGEEAARELREEIGDLLFIVVNLARKLGIDPEDALEGTNRKFRRRFDYLEGKLAGNGVSLEEAGMEEMDRLWVEAKELGRVPGSAGCGGM